MMESFLFICLNLLSKFEKNVFGYHTTLEYMQSQRYVEIKQWMTNR